MGIKESLSISIDSITANKLRSILTMLGIIIGVGAVIALMSIGRGAQASVTARVSNLGTNLVFVRPGAPSVNGVSQAQGSAQSLTLQDAQALDDPEMAPSVLAVAPSVNAQGQVVAGKLNVRTRILGVTDTYAFVTNYTVAEGDFITPQQITAKASVAVLGSATATSLFPDGDALGQFLRINQQQFTVAGILASKGSSGLGSQDNVVLVPITTAMARLTSARTAQGGRTVNDINVKASAEKEVSNAKAQITAILQERHKILNGQDDFTVTTQEDTLSALNQITGVFTMFLGSIAGISLLVGGIGIMNIMLVSVTERTREIGIRKAVGAKKKDILTQFLVESATLSLSGGAIGLLLGVGASRVVSGLNLNGQPLQTVVSPDIMILAVVVSAAIGIFFGIYPASRAASLHPIDALRSE